jgi:hypothetical protein
MTVQAAAAPHWKPASRPLLPEFLNTHLRGAPSRRLPVGAKSSAPPRSARPHVNANPASEVFHHTYTSRRHACELAEIQAKPSTLTRGAYWGGPLHTGHVRVLEAFRNAASGLAEHPQDHGWRDLYRVFSHGFDRSAPNLTATVLAHHSARPTSSETHLLTLLGIALKEIAPVPFESIISGGSADFRLDALEETLDRYGAEIIEMIRGRQNSFTSARRFLVPQILLSAYFARQDGQEARFADFGTGLGIMPRQLNSPEQYRAFAKDLVWPSRIPAFRQIPLAARLGVDRGPMPDLNWVHACYGKSDYYAHLYNELLYTMASPEVNAAEVGYEEIDLLDFESVAAFIHKHKINVANLTYVLSLCRSTTSSTSILLPGAR